VKRGGYRGGRCIGFRGRGGKARRKVSYLPRGLRSTSKHLWTKRKETGKGYALEAQRIPYKKAKEKRVGRGGERSPSSSRGGKRWRLAIVFRDDGASGTKWGGLGWGGRKGHKTVRIIGPARGQHESGIKKGVCQRKLKISSGEKWR